jgi:nucleolar protein 14
MAKIKKNKKSGLSDKILDKKSKRTQQKVNPFELHVNSNQKFAVINRKTTHSFGKPGVSRGKATEKRKQTLGQEFEVKNKTNSFKDNRRNGNSFKPKKESIFNLNDDFELTHRGQKLAEIERFDEPVADEDEVSDEENRLDGTS